VSSANTFGGTLARAREQRRWSQVDLSAKVGVQSSHISRIEANERRPSADLVIRLAEALGEDHNEWLVLAGYQPAGRIDVSAQLALRIAGIIARIKGKSEQERAIRLLEAFADDLEDTSTDTRGPRNS
jgi:transcriptional regulator with XRE-family HTH domain